MHYDQTVEFLAFKPDKLATWPQNRLDAVRKRKRLVLSRNRTTVLRSVVCDLVSKLTEISRLPSLPAPFSPGSILSRLHSLPAPLSPGSLLSRLPSPAPLVYKSVVFKRVTSTEICGGVYSTGGAARWPRSVIWLYELYGTSNIKRCTCLPRLWGRKVIPRQKEKLKNCTVVRPWASKCSPTCRLPPAVWTW
jgi:hypothetical protein